MMGVNNKLFKKCQLPMTKIKKYVKKFPTSIYKLSIE